MRILIALLVMVAGLGLVFQGYQLARFIIPLWGFISGVALGGAMTADFTGESFLGSVFGILVALALGIFFALISYFYYAAAIIITAGLIGYWAGSSLMYLFGLDPGFLSAVSGILLGLALGTLALLLNAPKYVLIVFTALAGAVTTIGGILLLFNVVPLEFFSYTASSLVVKNSFWWSLLAIALAAVGAVVQSRTPGLMSQAAVWDSIDDDHMSHHTGPMVPTHTH